MKPENSYNSSIASTYDADRQNEEHWAKEDAFIQGHFRDRQVPVLLDLPVGTGRFIEHYPKDSEVWGIDISQDMLDQSRKRLSALGRSARLDIGDATNLTQISNASVDSIVCCRLFHLVDDAAREKILREFARIMRGELVLQAYLDAPPRNIVIRILGKLVRIARGTDGAKGSASEQTPWSHIKSYPMTEARLLALFAAVHLTKIQKTYLCDYFGRDVVMFIVKK